MNIATQIRRAVARAFGLLSDLEITESITLRRRLPLPQQPHYDAVLGEYTGEPLWQEEMSVAAFPGREEVIAIRRGRNFSIEPDGLVCLVLDVDTTPMANDHLMRADGSRWLVVAAQQVLGLWALRLSPA